MVHCLVTSRPQDIPNGGVGAVEVEMGHRVEIRGAGEHSATPERLALFLYLDHPTKSDVTSGKIAG